jgi:carbamoyl-phosphate synthase small subunit
MSKQPAHSVQDSLKAGHPERGDFFNFLPAELVLSDGTRFPGFSPQWQEGEYFGEVVFNTGMTGYVESLTDPSYSGQILTFTYPLIGNYGVSAPSTWESEKIHAHGVVVSEACENWSHSGSQYSLLEWLHQQGIPIITRVDTRALTKHLRAAGTMTGVISMHPGKTRKVEKKFVTPLVIPSVTFTHQTGKKKRVIVVDCGMKQNILRSLLTFPVEAKQVPATYDYTGEAFDGILLSNGPGDPLQYEETITILRKALKVHKPIFGICLGSQLLGLAAGAKTYKLQYGHRGHNQPCQDTHTKRCYLTSQNHGYALDERTFPKGWKVNFRNLNDDSVEGIEHVNKPWFSVQFHPEATPGPTDTAWLFDRFYHSL